MHIGAIGTWMDTNVLSATPINAVNYLAGMPRSRARLANLDGSRRQNPSVPRGFSCSPLLLKASAASVQYHCDSGFIFVHQASEQLKSICMTELNIRILAVSCAFIRARDPYCDRLLASRISELYCVVPKLGNLAGVSPAWLRLVPTFWYANFYLFSHIMKRNVTHFD